MRSTSRRSPTFIGVLLADLLTAVYWKGLSGGFAFDETSASIMAIRSCALAVAGKTPLRSPGSGAAGPLGRGLSMLSFALNYRFR